MDLKVSFSAFNLNNFINFSFLKHFLIGVMRFMNYNFRGLSSEEVKKRKAEGKANVSANLKTKSFGRIFYDNICTLFNLINVLLFLALLFVGSYKNMLFMGVVLSNIAIGIFQEIRSKMSVDKLTILSEKKVNVLRNEEIVEISKDEIVLDDIIVLSRGAQIPADCIVVDGNCKVNESLLTGESNLIEKKVGDELLSGSFINSGKCLAGVTKVGADCYAARINNEAKYIKKINSQILQSFNFIIKICTCILFPVAVFFFMNQYGIENGDLQNTVVSTVAALLGMIPKGMVLLTSSVLAVSIIRLSKQKVLVQEMYCIETLARVDVLCLDKTGTLTTDEMKVERVIKLTDFDNEIGLAISSIVNASDEKNATINSLEEYSKGTASVKCKHFHPFSSETKWSGGEFENGKTYVLGAAEFVFKDRSKYEKVYKIIESITDTVRIVAIATSNQKIKGDNLPSDLSPLAIILIKDKLRDNVNETIKYFSEQGVALKVISGDSVKTVQNIAKDTGIKGYENAVDMSMITSDEELYRVAEKCSVFGRVTPQQKKKLVVALKEQGHSVAMTGDGVNDVLALKEADCSVAMAAGSEAARNVSQLVLVNNDFAAMPGVVAEGRRTINNLERSSSLYLVKTIYSVILSLFFVFFNGVYPFEPIQQSLIGALAVALPSFLLALQPNKNIIKGNFTFNIIARAIPAAVCITLNIILLSVFKNMLGLSSGEFSTISVYLTALSSMLLVLRLSYPFNTLRYVMLFLSTAGLLVAFIFFGSFFSLVALDASAVIVFICFALGTIAVFDILHNIAEHYIKKSKISVSNSKK